MKGRAHAFAFKREKLKEKSRMYYVRQVCQSGHEQPQPTDHHQRRSRSRIKKASLYRTPEASELL